MRALTASRSPVSLPILPVLRIGVVRNRKIVHEQVFRVGEAVCVRGTPLGSGPRGDGFFVSSEGQFQVNVPDGVEARIAGPAGVRVLEGRTAVLEEGARGKFVVGDTTVLFQVLPGVPQPARPPADFRPRLWDDDDPVFHGLLGVFTIAAAAFMIWVTASPLPEPVMDVRRVTEVLPPIRLIDRPAPVAPPAAPEVARPAPRPSALPPSVPAPPRGPRLTELERLIGTFGPTTDAATAVLGDEDVEFERLKAALALANRGAEASTGAPATKRGSDREDVVIHGPEATAGAARIGEGAVLVARAVVDEERVEVIGGDRAAIGSVVRASGGRVQSCVEQGLKVDPALSGRVKVGWTIQAGRVVSPRLLDNTTGNAKVGECVVGAVRGMRFDASIDADGVEFPWAVSGV